MAGGSFPLGRSVLNHKDKTAGLGVVCFPWSNLDFGASSRREPGRIFYSVGWPKAKNIGT